MLSDVLIVDDLLLVFDDIVSSLEFYLDVLMLLWSLDYCF